ncbi:MAG: DUF2023 family protein [Bacteroidales bacterium]
MEVLNHHIYEYKKGLRNLVLHTMSSENLEQVENRLQKQGINYLIQHINHRKMNVFFGKRECVRIVDSFNKRSLSQLSAEEDFMLGIMLGYDRMQQCQRFLMKTNTSDGLFCKQKLSV